MALLLVFALSVLVLAALLVGFVWGRGAVGTEVAAEKFVLRDGGGTRYGELGIRREQPYLLLIGKNGGEATLTVAPEGTPGAILRSATGSAIEVTALNGGGAGFSVRGESGSYLVWLGVSAEGKSSIRLETAEGRVIFSAP